MTEYIRRHDLDIVYIQEITSTDVLNTLWYETYNNIGTQMHGTATLARREIPLTNITKLLKGWAIGVVDKGFHLVNTHTPSGTARRMEREYFYNAEMPQLLQVGHGDLILGGDFNCVTDPADTTGTFQTVGPSRRWFVGYLSPTRGNKIRPDPPLHTILPQVPAKLIEYTCPTIWCTTKLALK